MEQYLRRKPLAAWADALGVLALIYAASVMWFVGLWGLGMPALLAGAALGTLLMMARACLRRQLLTRRERALRSRLGAELFMEELLLAEPGEAHRMAAELLGRRWPLAVLQNREDGVLCRQGEERLLIICLQTPPDGALSAGDLASAQRAVRRAGADRGVLCVPARTPPAILARAEQTRIPLRIVRRETIAALAARAHPASDEQLVALGQRRRRGAQDGVLSLVFRRDKARRYFGYGLAMTLMYLLMGVRVYAVAGLTCLSMAVMCRRGHSEERL